MYLYAIFGLVLCIFSYSVYQMKLIFDDLDRLRNENPLNKIIRNNEFRNIPIVKKYESIFTNALPDVIILKNKE